MTPIKTHFWLDKIKKSKDADTAIADLTEKQDQLLFDALSKKMWAKKESKEIPLKQLEQERKTAAIAEFERLGMKTNKRVEAINDIKFLDNKILIGKTSWAYENMKWGLWLFKERTNKRYYNLKDRIAEAKKQKLILPKVEDFENTFEALDLEKNNRIWKHILAIILWERGDGYCAANWTLYTNYVCGHLGSISKCNKEDVRTFNFDRDEGTLYRDDQSIKFICRPLVK